MLYTHDGASKKKKPNIADETKPVEKKTRATSSDSSDSSDTEDDDDDDNNAEDDELSLSSTSNSMPTDDDSELFGTMDDKTRKLFFVRKLPFIIFFFLKIYFHVFKKWSC